MTERRTGAVGDRDVPAGGDRAARGDENTSVTGVPSEPGRSAGMERIDRADRDPGETERGDDDWGAPDAGRDMGPADAPSGPDDSGGS